MLQIADRVMRIPGCGGSNWATYGFLGVWLAGVGFSLPKPQGRRITLPVRFRLVRDALNCASAKPRLAQKQHVTASGV